MIINPYFFVARYLIDIDHETGDLSEYDATTGGVSATAGAAIHGSYGLNVNITDTTIDRCRVGFTKSTKTSVRIYFDTNSLTMADADTFDCFILKQSAGSLSAIFTFRLRYYTATGYAIRFIGWTDPSYVAHQVNISDGVHYIEVYAEAAADATSSDGVYKWYLDGTLQNTDTGLDNYNKMTDEDWNLDVGAVSNIDAGTSGDFYIDSIIATDDGAYIGAA